MANGPLRAGGPEGQLEAAAPLDEVLGPIDAHLEMGACRLVGTIRASSSYR